MDIALTPELKEKLVAAQRNEETESRVYENISRFVKDEDNKQIIIKISAEEKKHARIWKSYTNQEVNPDKYKVWLYTNIVRYFGLTFGLKLMESGEKNAIINYAEIGEFIPAAKSIQEDEENHERQLIDLLKDKSINYLGSIVLGLNDALVELTGVLAGLTFGLQNTRMIAFVGIITGISAAFSMAGSEYLSTKTDDDGNVKPVTAAIYTGIAYITTVILLILPYLLVQNIYLALGLCISTAILIIAIFNYYTSVAKGHAFKSRFLEMAGISLSVAFISFIIGTVVKYVFNIEI
ncbi:VIT1/CCC1 transporter family protein [Viscerimonas tarda]